jgi:uncharacterized DUF497 family protein
MGGGVFVIKDDDSLVEMTEQPYDSEDILQNLIARYPNLLAGDQMDAANPRRWILNSREFGLPSNDSGVNRWSVDHLFIDQDGIPTLVEVKRSSDTRIRREVVGQMLDYAANAVVFWPIERIISRFEAQCTERGVDVDTELQALLGAEFDANDFWTRVRDNLRIGKIRMVFVADVIPDELKRIVEFLNSQMNPAEVFAVEIKQYVGESLKTLVPRVIGRTAEAMAAKSVSSNEGILWNEESFMKAIQDVSDREVAARILAWSKSNVTRVWWGRGKTEGSYVPIFHHNGVDYQLFAVRTGAGSGATVELYFHYYQSKPAFQSHDSRRTLLAKINAILEKPLPDEVISKLPKVPLRQFREPVKVEAFLDAYEWFLEHVRTGH